MKSAVVFGLIGVGLLLLLASGVWASLFPGTSSWSDEKDQRLSEIGARLHVLTFTVAKAEAQPSMHKGPDILKAKAEHDSLAAEYKALSDEFRGIQARPHTTSRIMKWSGISFMLVGIVGWYAINQTG